MPTPDLNWLDRAISWFSPRAGLMRASARMATETLAAYEGAKTGRRTDGWITTGSDANAALAMDLPRLRDRSRDLIRNTPEGKRMKKTIVTSTVGTGIIPEPDTGDPKLDDEIRRARDIHFDECDADGQLDYFGQQQMEVEGIFESGEALVRRRSRRPSDGLHVPMQYQVLESDHLDHNASANPYGGVTVQGVVRDKIGRRAGYWMWPVHPGATAASVTQRQSYAAKLIDASEIAHGYCKDRPGQERGVPWLHPLILLMRDMDEYNDAEMVRAKIAACMSVFVEQTADPDVPGFTIGKATTESSTGLRLESMRPGMIIYGKPGERATPIVPPGHANFAEFMRFQQHRAAVGVGMFYAQLTGDLGSVNWSSFRAGDRDFRGVIEAFRWLTVIPMVLAPKWRWFIDAAYLAGRISRIHYGVTWTPPQFMSVNPIADAQADEYDLANGTLEFGEANRRRGNDPEKQYARIVEWNKRMAKDGVVFAWDRSKVNASGSIQSTSPDGPATQQQQR